MGMSDKRRRELLAAGPLGARILDDEDRDIDVGCNGTGPGGSDTRPREDAYGNEGGIARYSEGSLLNQTADELSRVQDEGSADAARPKMQGVWKRYEELSRQLYTLVQTPGVQRPPECNRHPRRSATVGLEEALIAYVGRHGRKSHLLKHLGGLP